MDQILPGKQPSTFCFSDKIKQVYVVFFIHPFWFLIKSTGAATRGVLQKNVFLEISQNSQENTSARDSFLIKLEDCFLSYQWYFTLHTFHVFRFIRFCAIFGIQRNNFVLFSHYHDKDIYTKSGYKSRDM